MPGDHVEVKTQKQKMEVFSEDGSREARNVAIGPPCATGFTHVRADDNLPEMVGDRRAFHPLGIK